MRGVTCQVLGGQRLVADVTEAAAERFEIGQRVHLTVRRVVLEAEPAARPGAVVEIGAPAARLTA